MFVAILLKPYINTFGSAKKGPRHPFILVFNHHFPIEILIFIGFLLIFHDFPIEITSFFRDLHVVCRQVPMRIRPRRHTTSPLRATTNSRHGTWKAP